METDTEGDDEEPDIDEQIEGMIENQGIRRREPRSSTISTNQDAPLLNDEDSEPHEDQAEKQAALRNINFSKHTKYHIVTGFWIQNNYLVFVTQDRVNQEYYLEVYRPDLEYCWCRRVLFKTEGMVSVVARPDSTRRYAVILVEVCDTTSGKI